MANDSLYRSGIARVDVRNTTDEILLALRADVAVDGGSVRFGVHVTNREPFNCRIDFADMPAVFAEVNHASRLMLMRQRNRCSDRGAARLQQLAAQALQPTASTALVDRDTGDRIFVHQFSDHPPIALRLTIDEFLAIREQLCERLAQHSH